MGARCPSGLAELAVRGAVCNEELVAGLQPGNAVVPARGGDQQRANMMLAVLLQRLLEYNGGWLGAWGAARMQGSGPLVTGLWMRGSLGSGMVPSQAQGGGDRKRMIKKSMEESMAESAELMSPMLEFRVCMKDVILMMRRSTCGSNK